MSKIEFCGSTCSAFTARIWPPGCCDVKGFLFYELVALTVISKQPSGVLRPGAVGQRRPDQDVIDAITSLRESGQIPWDAIVGETRSLEDHTGWASIVADVNAYLNVLELDPWGGAAPLILTESRSLAGVLRALMRQYGVKIAPTNGQTNGFLRNDVAKVIDGRDAGARISGTGTSPAATSRPTPAAYLNGCVVTISIGSDWR